MYFYRLPQLAVSAAFDADKMDVAVMQNKGKVFKIKNTRAVKFHLDIAYRIHGTVYIKRCSYFGRLNFFQLPGIRNQFVVDHSPDKKTDNRCQSPLDCRSHICTISQW